MPAGLKGLNINLAWLVLVAGLTLPTPVVLAGEQLSAEQIINALKPPRLTRGLTSSPADAAPSAEEASFVNSLRNRKTRSLTADERDKIETIAKTKPSIDLEINFEYNSAAIGREAMPQVEALGQALTSADLKGATFLVAGHTDAVGSQGFNQGLSERRADAVKRFLLEKYGVEGSQLVAVGYGKTQLKKPADPFSAENRRVQVVNFADR
jgi:outer membrane protein OmpA-like peptidoglycan-associated protein